ncbi:type IX secretion system motor protein PorM/GldM [Psychroserpens luteus]|uniref:Gliding motility protein GldM n=1 Tax=Psychroserpens luteus TaxID=1434066 RepID=A0ABW5ZXY5_9FLAO|nr:gliding motility protein GldM [Psychroserpens luteus]
MAGGKQSARQKMINLMYLVFIAMIAMTMSKEVLSAFGLMNAKFVRANELATSSNMGMLEGLALKAEEKPEEFRVASNNATQINTISEGFFKYLDSQKALILEKGKFEREENGDLPSEEMDKGDFLDEYWFTGDRLTKAGEAFMERLNKYKADVKAILGDDIKYETAIANFDKRFDTNEVVNNDGKKQQWLDYHFQGFPAIASYTKITAMQNDVKATETNMYNLFLGNTLDAAVSLKNYTAIVIADKSAFFAGEKFQGKVVLGKYANVTPTGLSIGGQSIDLNNAIDSTGAARLDFNVGGVGEQEIKGTFTFLEDGKPLEIPIKGNYVVVPRPNSATISADKMNVVYRGVVNPMTISFAGVPDNKVRATGAGLKSASGMGKYTMVPTSGREVTISVSATLDDGSNVNDKAVFRIKDIPKPAGQMAGKSDPKLPRNNVAVGKVEAVLEDFDFDLPLTVTGFKMKVEGKPSVVCSGNRLNGAAKSALASAKRGSQVQIFDIKSRSNGPAIKPASPIIITLTN